MRRRTVKTLAGLVALALLLTSCGGSSDDESLTKAEFIKQGDAICKRADQKYLVDFEEFLKTQGINELPSKSQSIEIVADIYVPNVEARLSRLKELSPPEADQAQAEAIYESTEAAIAAIKKNAAAVYMKNPFKESKALSERYGFKVCVAV